MRAPKAASSDVVRPSRPSVSSRLGAIVLYIAALVTLAALASAASGCKKKGEATAEAAVVTPVVKDLTDGLQLTWIDDKGEFHVEQRVADVPAASRDVVRVRVLESGSDPSGDRVFIADLRNAGADGTYPVQAVPRAQFEDVAVARRTKSGTAVLAPKGAASGVAAGAGGNAGQPQGGTGIPGDVAGRPAVIIYGASWCGPCHQAAAYLKKKGVAFVEHDIEQDSSSQHEMQAKLAKAGMRGGSIPVLDVRGKILVGFDARAVDQALGTAL
jgi:glutaredoxin